MITKKNFHSSISSISFDLKRDEGGHIETMVLCNSQMCTKNTKPILVIFLLRLLISIAYSASIFASKLQVSGPLVNINTCI